MFLIVKLQALEDYLRAFVGTFPNGPAFLEFSSKCLSMSVSVISEKVNGFTNDTFSRINLILG